MDLKTRLGPMNRRTGVRHDPAKGVELRQLLCYALWDLDDEYGITEVGMYAARYRVLHRWPLDEFMGTMANRYVNLAEDRSLIRDLLENPPEDSSTAEFASTGSRPRSAGRPLRSVSSLAGARCGPATVSVSSAHHIPKDCSIALAATATPRAVATERAF